MTWHRLSILTLIALLLVSVGVLRAHEPADEAPESTSDTKILEAPDDPPNAEQLPEFDQRVIVSQQKGRLPEYRQKLQVQLLTSESDHFLLFSDLDSRVRRAILTWLEDLRVKLTEQLGLPADTRLWDGKCLVVVFAQQKSLAKYAQVFDNHAVERPRGYFVMEARRVRGPRLVHIAAYQPVKGGNEALQEVLVHETTHAIIELYKKTAPLPLWVHEGLAEYMTVLMNPVLRTRKHKGAYGAASANPYVSIRDLFKSRFSARNHTAYSVSMALVECLHSIDGAGVLRYVELLKKGVEAEKALGQAYPGLDYDTLETRWKRFVLINYRPPVRGPGD
jgi:Peptidase MA superfamily